VTPEVRDVLVVDDSRVALRFLQSRLRRRVTGCTWPRCLAGAPNADLPAFLFVFLDVMLEPAAEPRVLLCASTSNAALPNLRRGADRCHGHWTDQLDRPGPRTLAGCDAYLTKPLQEKGCCGRCSSWTPIKPIPEQ